MQETLNDLKVKIAKIERELANQRYEHIKMYRNEINQLISETPTGALRERAKT
jgi:hypothetical protein